MKEILNLANDCLNCKVKPCSVKGCPIKTNIPEFISMVKNENYEEAYKILQENNLSSYICSLVCPQEEQCEGSCVKGIKTEPVHIGNLEKAVNEWAIKNNYEYKIDKKESNGKKVAIIGSGPAGLACSIELLKEGFSVDVYEKDKLPGGILVYGIPDFRLSKSIVEELINKIKKLGANFITEKELGKDIFLTDLSKEYDAVFVAIGATKSTTYSLSENDINGVYKSDEFLKAYNEKQFINNLGKVVVIGGGNVAMDSARAAIKMGAEEVKILYRRDRSHMPAREVELDDAIKDGVKFKELVRVISADSENGIIKNVNCVETEIIDGKAVDKSNAENYKEEANTVVFAIGLKPDKNLLQNQGIELDDWGYVKIDENGRTNLENVYAGGDNTESKATVCRALAAGKKAAQGIIKNIK
ncbi:MAG: FAD-dependent oxidoreductase [Clostridia bacterium]|nr:FAD-dependent oxidoreductase [Clostridia bacterium]